jgi:predicted GTPase
MKLIKINERVFYIVVGHLERIDQKLASEAAFIYQFLINTKNVLILKDRIGDAPRLASLKELEDAIKKLTDFYNPPEIKVTITGPTGSGKSSVAAALMEALTRYDLPVTWESMDENQVDVTAIYRVKLNKMRERGTKIRILDSNEK